MSTLFEISGDVSIPSASSVAVRQVYDGISDFRVRSSLEGARRTIPNLDQATDALGKNLSISIANTTVIEGKVWAHQVHMEDGPRNAWVELIGQCLFGTMSTRVNQRAHDGADQSVLEDVLNQHFSSVDIEAAQTAQSSQNDSERVVVQATDDWSFVKMLADRNGLGLWVGYQPSTKVFAQQPTTSNSAMTVRINQSHSNISKIDLVSDVRRISSVSYAQIHLHDKETSRFELSSSSAPSIARTLDSFSDVQSLLDSPISTADEVDRFASSVIAKQKPFVQARAETNYRRFPHVVSVGETIELSGCGFAYDGDYFVCEVLHEVDERNHKMTFSLLRDHLNRSVV